MNEIFLKIIEQLNSSVIILLLIIIWAFIVVFKVWKLTEKFFWYDSKHKNAESKLDDISSKIHDISAKVNIVYENYSLTVKRQSPVSLTSIWEKISSDLSIKDIINKYWIDIEKYLNKKNLKNAYDIQVSSMDLTDIFFEKNFSEDDKSNIKNYAFKNWYNLIQIFPILSVIIRDKYLRQRWFELSEVDKHDPKSTIIS